MNFDKLLAELDAIGKRMEATCYKMSVALAEAKALDEKDLHEKLEATSATVAMVEA